MSRKKRLRKLEKTVSGLVKSVSRLERRIRKIGRRGIGIPAKQSGPAKVHTVEVPAAKRTRGSRPTSARKAHRKRPARARNATGKRAKASGDGVLAGLPS